MDRTVRNLQWDSLLKEIESRCASSAGIRTLSNLEMLPLNEMKERQSLISDIKTNILQGRRPPLAGISDISSLLERCKKGGILSLEEIVVIKDFTTGIQNLEDYIQESEEDFTSLHSQKDIFQDHTPLTELLKKALTDRGGLSKAHYPQLRKLEDAIANQKKELDRAAAHFVNSEENLLQEKIQTTRNNRVVVLLKSGMKGRVKGTVHDISSTGQTLYFEPDILMEKNSALLMLHQELNYEIQQILQELSGHVHRYTVELEANLQSAGYIDLLTAGAFFSIDTNSSEVELSPDPVLALKQVRHPLLYLMIQQNVVANDVDITPEKRSIIISGANTGGKTVLMKAVALSVLLVRYGFHAPCGSDSIIGFFDSVLADIGDDQNMEESLSSFSGQVVIINEMLQHAGSTSLVLIDEIMAGTAPKQGAALARSCLEALADKGSAVLATTHYPELKELAVEDSRFINASVSFDLESLKPTYRLHTGIPGVSYALEIASMYGLPDEVIMRTRELIDSKSQSLEELAEDIQKQHRELEEKEAELISLQSDLEKEKGVYREKQQKLKEEKLHLSAQQGVELLGDLKRYQEKLASRINELQSLSMEEAVSVSKEVVEAAGRVEKKIQEKRKEISGNRAVDMSNIEEGCRVYIPSLDREGIVASFNKEKNQAEIRLGNMTTRQKFDALIFKAPPVREKPKQEKRSLRGSEPGTKTEVTLQTAFNTVDLRGMRVEEGLSEMDSQLDRMFRSGISAAVVIHGHGTGAMKNAVREHLAHSAYTGSYRSGKEGEGGDGVTIVVL